MPALADLPPMLVVDASVGIKWIVEETNSDQAIALIAGRRLLVPDLFWVETANALAAKVRRLELTRGQARDAWHDLTRAPLLSRKTTAESVSSAFGLAQDLAHPVYDCLYLALALHEDCRMVTADHRFAQVVSGHASLAGALVILSEIRIN